MPFVPPSRAIAVHECRYAAPDSDTSYVDPAVEYVSDHYSLLTAMDGYMDVEVRPHVRAPVYRIARQAIYELMSTPDFERAKRQHATAALAALLLPQLEERFSSLVERWLNRA